MFTLICARINGWVNNGEAGDLRRNRAHYDVIVMSDVFLVSSLPSMFPISKYKYNFSCRNGACINWTPFCRQCFQIHFNLKKIFVFWFKFNRNLLLAPLANNSALVQLMAWCLISYKAVSQPTLTLTQLNMRHRPCMLSINLCAVSTEAVDLLHSRHSSRLCEILQ